MIGRIAALMLALMLVTGALAEGAYVIQTSALVTLVDGEGNSLIEDNSARVAFEVIKNALYAMGSVEGYTLYDARGNLFNDERYQMVEAVGDVLLFRQHGYYGAMDMAGRTLIPPEWTQLTYAGNGTFLALEGDLYDDQPDEMISLNLQGERVNTGSYTAKGLDAFHEGYMAYMLSDGQYGYVDARGRQVIPPQWQYAGDFSEGVAIVSNNGQYGLVDAKGGVTLLPRYNSIVRGDGFIAALTAEGWVDAFSGDASKLLYSLDEPVNSLEVFGKYMVAQQDDVRRLYGPGGACLFEANKDFPYGFEPGLNDQVIVRTGLLDGPNSYVLNPDGSEATRWYRDIMPLSGGRYIYGINPMTVVGWSYENLRYLGMVAGDGRDLLDADYINILSSGDDRLVLVTEDSVIFADLDGNAIRTWPITETAAPSSEAGA